MAARFAARGFRVYEYWRAHVTNSGFASPIIWERNGRGSLAVGRNLPRVDHLRWRPLGLCAAWTATAHPGMTTSLAAIRFPDLPMLPESIRGRQLVAIHFACPGNALDGAAIVAPLRALAPVEADDIELMSVANIVCIHNHPGPGGPVQIRGMLLSEADDALASAIPGEAGPGLDTPLNIAEVRHPGGAIRDDVSGGSAVNGRHASYLPGAGALNPASFACAATAASWQFRAGLQPWTLPENAIAFPGTACTKDDFDQSWSPESPAQLDQILRRIDPDGVFSRAKPVAMPV